jgi:carbonic anhydrase
MTAEMHGKTCSCCGEWLGRGLGRRAFMKLAGGAGLLAAMPFAAFAAGGKYDAMLLSCIDPRMPEPTLDYMKGRGLLGRYSQFTIAGAAIGAVAPAFAGWHKTFWDNLAASIELHRITRVIALDHRDCGAARIAYGTDSIANPQREAETHRAALIEFRREAKERHPELAVETGLMALDGSVDMFGV